MVGDEIEHGWIGEELNALTFRFYHPGNPVGLRVMHHRPWLPAPLALVTALLGVAYAAGSAAQNLLNAEVAAQPIVYMDAGAPRGCGLRLFAAYVGSDRWIVTVETSIDVYADETADFKGEVSEFAAPIPGRNANPVAVAIDSVWVKSPDIDATQPVLGKVEKGDDGYSLRYVIAGDSAIAVMLSAMKGESILFGFRRTGKPAEYIYVGAPKPTRGESEQLQRCISNLSK